VIGGCLGVCGVLLVAGLVFLGVLAGIREDAGTPGEASTPGETAGPKTSVPSSTGEPDDFLYKSESGLVYIAPNQVVAEGVSVVLAGVWREDHRSITLRILEDGHYQLTVGGGALGGTSRSDLVASNSAEQGTWTLDGTTLTLTPGAYGLSGLAEGKTSSGSGTADGPRQWNVVGLTIEYTPSGSDTARRRPGLRVSGPSPSWYYPPGDITWDFRSAR